MMRDIIDIEKDIVSTEIVVYGDAVYKIGQSAALTVG